MRNHGEAMGADISTAEKRTQTLLKTEIKTFFDFTDSPAEIRKLIDLAIEKANAQADINEFDNAADLLSSTDFER